MSENIRKRFNDFIELSHFLSKGSKGPLAVGLTVTRYAIKSRWASGTIFGGEFL
jgi:hypothetical protein